MVMRWMTLVFCLFIPALAAPGYVSGAVSAQTFRDVHSAALSRTGRSPHPLFVVGIEGGFTGVTMTASVYADGTVRTLRHGGSRPDSAVETRVPVYRSAVRAVVQHARRTGAFTIPKSIQDQTFGADIPVLSFSLFTSRGVKTVHAMGGESNHAPGTAAFFPIWGLLYALAGYPPQIS